MRLLPLVTLLAAGGCVSDAALARVQIVGAKPSCDVADPRLHGRGDSANAAMRDLRRHAAQAGITHVVVTDGPRADGASQVVDAIGYACPAAARETR